MRPKNRELWPQPNKQANKQDFDFNSAPCKETLVSGMQKTKNNSEKQPEIRPKPVASI